MWPFISNQKSMHAGLPGIFLCLLGCGLGAGCGLTVTNEKPSYQELPPQEKSVVDIVIEELTAFNQQVKQRTTYNIDNIINKERINVSFQGLIFSGNFGDNTIRVAVWENLTEEQRALVQTWFKSSSLAQAKQSYATLIYHFLTVAQGVKQYMYNVLTTEWIFKHRTLFTLERDSIRTALAHYVAVGKKDEMWNFLSTTCKPVIDQYGSTYADKFSKQYLMEHYTDLADPREPTGYMYFICRWIHLGMTEGSDLTIELNYLRDLALP